MVLTRAPLLAGGRPHTDLTITAEGQAATLTAALAASDASSSVTSIEDDHIKDEQASMLPPTQSNPSDSSVQGPNADGLDTHAIKCAHRTTGCSPRCTSVSYALLRPLYTPRVSPRHAPPSSPLHTPLASADQSLLHASHMRLPRAPPTPRLHHHRPPACPLPARRSGPAGSGCSITRLATRERSASRRPASSETSLASSASSRRVCAFPTRSQPTPHDPSRPHSTPPEPA